MFSKTAFFETTSGVASLPRRIFEHLPALLFQSFRKAKAKTPVELGVLGSIIGLLRLRGWHKDALEFERAFDLEPAPQQGPANNSADRVLGVMNDTIISTLHFRPLSDPADQRLAVKCGLRMIDMEIFSQCNRRCHYCSNAVFDRISANNFMDEDLYRGILSDLAEVDWDGQFRFIGLNEPTMHREFLIARIREARAAIPKALLVIFTNGDYLSRDYLDEIYEAGVRSLYVSVHLQKGTPFDDNKILHRIGMLKHRLKLEFELDVHVPGVSVVGRVPYRDMDIQVFQHDYERIGHDRGGILNGIGRQDYVRTSACHVPIQMMVISYNGNVLPCCHFVGDAPQHQSLVVGKFGQGKSLFEIYSSPEYLSWRRDLFTLGPKGKECRNCVDYADSDALKDPTVVASAALPVAPTSRRRKPAVKVICGSRPGSIIEGAFRER